MDYERFTISELIAQHPDVSYRAIRRQWYVIHGEGLHVRIKDTEQGRELAKKLHVEVSVIYP